MEFLEVFLLKIQSNKSEMNLLGVLRGILDKHTLEIKTVLNFTAEQRCTQAL